VVQEKKISIWKYILGFLVRKVGSLSCFEEFDLGENLIRFEG